MEIKEAIEKQTRNIEEEKEILLQFHNILKPYININDIKKRLDNNGFQGLYLLDNDIFHMIDNMNVDDVGLYSWEEKVIVIDKDAYNLDKKTGIHEMGHAFLDGENKRKIIVDERELVYGRGLEEGAMALLESNLNIENIDLIDKRVYPLQSKLFQQLNVLYNYSGVNEYKNILIHLFMEPKFFLPLIKDVYEDIYKSNFSGFNSMLALKSAFNVVVGTDALLEVENNDLYNWLNYMNELYLNIADEKIRNCKKNNSLFPTSKDFKETREEVLFYNLFGKDDCYLERQQSNLDELLRRITEILEKWNYMDINDDKKKILLPSVNKGFK